MKELSIEEKAKAYDEAIKVAQRFYNNSVAITKKGLEDIFPELQESEGERIRKKIIATIHLYYGEPLEDEAKEMIAWLEAQGEQKPVTDFSDLRTWKYIVDAVWTEKEGIGQYLDSPFTEEVAKKLQKRFGKIEQKQDVNIQINPSEYINDMGGNGCYLKNTTQNHAWSEEDERKLLEIKCLIGNYRTGNDEYELCSWIDKFKDRVLPQQQLEWSEEDENRLSDAVFFVREYQIPTRDKRLLNAAKEAEDWLKSLKERYTWKPSDEQMEALKGVQEGIFRLGILESLYNDLKRLLKI